MKDKILDGVALVIVWVVIVACVGVAGYAVIVVPPLRWTALGIGVVVAWVWAMIRLDRHSDYRGY